MAAVGCKECNGCGGDLHALLMMMIYLFLFDFMGLMEEGLAESKFFLVVVVVVVVGRIG